MANPTWAQKVPFLGKIVQYFRNDVPENPPVSDTPTEDTESVVTPAPDSEKRHNPLPKISHKKRIPQKTKTQRPVQIRRL